MTTHSQYTCAIGNSLCIHFPALFHELTPKHRLFDHVSGFSHLFAEALNMVRSRTIEWGLERVGFDLQQSHRIMRRLDGLSLVEGCNLISCAKLFLKAKRLLYGQTNCLWLGGNYKRQLFCVVQVVELDDEAKVVFLPWHLGEGKTVIARALIMGRIVTGGKIVSGCSQPALRKSLTTVISRAKLHLLYGYRDFFVG
ncbi:hypothetical protein ACIPLA_19725 [Pseudomonas sp. NPDC086112]|uniref:hypothetical protein n=1 Tax=Pseudomonas sp. NPDC086112 TaxID=3364430 RepID=UPI003818D169